MKFKLSAMLCGVAAALFLSSCATNAEAEGQPGAGSSTSVAPVTKVVMESSLVGYYAETSLADFARTPFITRVVTGRVVSAEPVVYDDATVYTEVSLQLEGAGAGTITAREAGGVVQVKDVQSAFEGHVSADALASSADQKIEFVDAEFPVRSRVGQRVIVMLSGQPSDPGGYFIAARLVLGGNGQYSWPADPPNAQWLRTLDGRTASKIARLK